MNTCFIYVITNRKNGKMYVGQTWGTINKRFNDHARSKPENDCPKLCNAIKKYGKINFNTSCLSIAHDQNQADILENFWIKTFDSIKNGYNLRDGGSRGRLSEKVKRKLSKIAKKNNRKPFLGRKHSKEAKKLIGESSRLRNSGNGNPFFGKKHSLKTKKKIAILATQRLSIPENNPMYGKAHSKETRDKLSKINKGKYAGIKNPAAKLTETEVNEIRNEYKKGNIIQKELRIKYGVSQRMISLIVRNEKWIF